MSTVTENTNAASITKDNTEDTNTNNTSTKIDNTKDNTEDTNTNNNTSTKIDNTEDTKTTNTSPVKPKKSNTSVSFDFSFGNEFPLSTFCRFAATGAVCALLEYENASWYSYVIAVIVPYQYIGLTLGHALTTKYLIPAIM
jgi:hypothetical protein